MCNLFYPPKQEEHWNKATSAIITWEYEKDKLLKYEIQLTKIYDGKKTSVNPFMSWDLLEITFEDQGINCMCAPACVSA